MGVVEVKHQLGCLIYVCCTCKEREYVMGSSASNHHSIVREQSVSGPDEVPEREIYLREEGSSPESKNGGS